MHRRARIAIPAAAAALAMGAPAFADMVVIGALKDNTLYEHAQGALSNGAGAFFFTGVNSSMNIRRGLLAFDVAGSVPGGATILGVTLTLHAQTAPNGAQQIDLHRLTSDWGEGASDAGNPGGQGAPAQPGDATWLHTFFNNQFWGTAGGDFVGTVSGSQVVDPMGFYTWGSTAQMVADVQMWLDSPLSDFGWILRGDETQVNTAKRFDTHEHPIEGNRPVLTVEYQVPAPPAFAMVLAAALGSRRRRA